MNICTLDFLVNAVFSKHKLRSERHELKSVQATSVSRGCSDFTIFLFFLLILWNSKFKEIRKCGATQGRDSWVIIKCSPKKNYAFNKCTNVKPTEINHENLNFKIISPFGEFESFEYIFVLDQQGGCRFLEKAKIIRRSLPHFIIMWKIYLHTRKKSTI